MIILFNKHLRPTVLCVHITAARKDTSHALLPIKCYSPFYSNDTDNFNGQTYQVSNCSLIYSLAITMVQRLATNSEDAVYQLVVFPINKILSHEWFTSSLKCFFSRAWTRTLMHTLLEVAEKVQPVILRLSVDLFILSVNSSCSIFKHDYFLYFDWKV